MILTATNTKTGLLAALVVLYISPSLATETSSPATVPNIFNTGDVIRASDMNDNFSAVMDAVNDVELTPGPQGIPGATGARGPTGAQGPAGVAGIPGATGAKGDVGPIGLTGATGAQGPAGADGIDGAVGMIWRGDWVAGTNYVVGDAVAYAGGSYIATQDTSGLENPSDISFWEVLAERGNDGADGAQGVAGVQGPAGIQGATGPQGDIGPIGLTGATGAPGANGAQGPAGPQGPAGIQGTQGDVGPIGLTGATGAQGADGAQGPVGATGAVGPAGPVSLVWEGSFTNATNYAINDAVSFNGSAYINIQDTNGTQDPTDTAYWELLASKGADGVQGLPGIDGTDGVDGNDGALGATGLQGPAGVQGATGPMGPAGPQGIAGSDGSNGIDGIDGFDGLDGDDAPNRTSDLCALYENLSGSGLITGLSIPAYCFYAIGDVGPAGGIVFYITDGGLHGLEAAPTDQNNAAWGCYGTVVPGADGTVIGTGAQNTVDIIAAGCGVGGAAEIADAYLGPDGTSEGWYLPSKDELNLMYTELHLNVVGGFAGVYHWSSSESDISFAWFQNFNDGNQYIGGKYDNTLRVRAARAF